MEWLIPIIVGLIALAGSVWSAFIVHGKTKTTIELKSDHQTEVLDTKIDHLQNTLEIKLKNIDSKVENVCEKVTVVEAKVNENIQETGKIKVKVVALEKDVEVLKKGGAGYVKI